MDLHNILFIDIETVGLTPNFDSLSKELQSFWCKKSKSLSNFNQEFNQENEIKNFFEEKSAIYAEFGKIIVIGIGYFVNKKFRVTALYKDNEKELLESFSNLLNNKFLYNTRLCAHNGKEFDFPYLCRRMLINDISLPKILNLQNKKPWEIMHLDTMEMWKFGDRKAYTSLDLLATIFNIKSSKEIMNGSQVHDFYYNKKDMDAIINYCIEDVIVLAQIFLKLNSLETIKNENIQIVLKEKV